MSIYFVQKPFTLTKGVDENSTRQFGNFVMPVSGPTKLIRYGIYFNEPTSDATPSDPFDVKVFFEGIGGGQTSSNATATNNINLVELSSTLGGLTITQYDVGTFLTTADKVFDEALIKPNTGYEVIVPNGKEVFNTGEDLIIGIKVTTGATLATGNVNGVFKIYIDGTMGFGP